MRYETASGCDEANTQYELINITYFFNILE